MVAVLTGFGDLLMFSVGYLSFFPGAPRDARPDRPPAAKQTEAGQPVASVARPAPAAASPVLVGQHERAAVQHPEPAHRPAQDVQRRGHGPEELDRYPKRYWTG